MNYFWLYHIHLLSLCFYSFTQRSHGMKCDRGSKVRVIERWFRFFLNYLCKFDLLHKVFLLLYWYMLQTPNVFDAVLLVNILATLLTQSMHKFFMWRRYWHHFARNSIKSEEGFDMPKLILKDDSEWACMIFYSISCEESSVSRISDKTAFL